MTVPVTVAVFGETGVLEPPPPPPPPQPTSDKLNAKPAKIILMLITVLIKNQTR